MAKKKSKSSNKKPAPKISPERFIREKSRSLPLGKCYITNDWQKNGIAHVIVTRKRHNGSLVVGNFLVDTFCLGVKDVEYFPDMSEYMLDERLRDLDSLFGIEEINYVEAHNILYGAIEWAAEAGIAPHKDFSVAQFILEEDTDEIPLIDYEFGRNGKYFLCVTSNPSEKRYINTLKERLGDNFQYLVPLDDEDDYEDEEDYDDDYDDYDDFDKLKNHINNDEKLKELFDRVSENLNISNNLPIEEYSYKYPTYPAALTVKHPFLVSELYNPDNMIALPDETIERILQLPNEELAEDLSRILMFEIGATYRAINDATIEDAENSPIIHALLLLTQTRSEKGLEAIFEVLHQNYYFNEYHFGDMAGNILPYALYACGKDQVDKIESYLYEPGLDSYMKSYALDALTKIAVCHPERRTEIIELFRRLLTSMVTRLPKQESCDGRLAGFFMCNLLDLKAKELIPEVEAVYATNCVDTTLTGSYNDFLRVLDNPSFYNESSDFPNIYEQYESLRKFYP